MDEERVQNSLVEALEQKREAGRSKKKPFLYKKMTLYKKIGLALSLI